MAIITFKFDESYKDKRTLMLAGWIADDKQWKRVESRWQKAIAFENKTLPDEYKIKRYHAAQMNAGDGPFAGWDDPRKHRFTNKLLKILSNGQMTAAGCGMDLRAFDELFPPDTRKPSDYGIAYIMCMGTLMLSIAESANTLRPDIRIAIVHDHGPWDKYALEGYNRWIDDDSWGEAKRFVSITPLSWEDDVGLQAADLIAYEGMRALDKELWTKNVDLRYALRELISSNVHIYGIYISREGLAGVAQIYEKEYGYKSGISKLRHANGGNIEDSPQQDQGQARSGEGREGKQKAEG